MNPFVQNAKSDSFAFSAHSQSLPWMVTFSDVLLLLLTFFALQISFYDFGMSDREYHDASHQNAEATFQDGSDSSGMGANKRFLVTTSANLQAKPNDDRRIIAESDLNQGSAVALGRESKAPQTAKGIDTGDTQSISFRFPVSEGAELPFNVAYAAEVIAEVTRGLGVGIEVEATASSWQAARLAALSFHRQLIDAGVEEKSVFLASNADTDRKADSNTVVFADVKVNFLATNSGERVSELVPLVLKQVRSADWR